MPRNRPLEPEERAKLEAETRQIDAHTKRIALERNVAAEELVQAQLTTEMKRMEWAIEDRAYRDTLLSDVYNHLYRFGSDVKEESVKNAVGTLDYWERLAEVEGEKPKTIEIRITSAGGSSFDGMVLFDRIMEMRNAGFHITTAAYGLCASMACVLLQAGTVRVAHKESWLLIHESQFGVGGKLGDVQDVMNLAQRLDERIKNIFVHRSKGSKCPQPLSLAIFTRNWKRKDWWLDSDEALRLGVVDEVR